MLKFLKSKWIALFIGLFALFFGANTALAGTPTQITVNPDVSETNIYTDHTISFYTSSTGAIEANGYIKITYPADFNTSFVNLGSCSANLGSASISQRTSDTITVKLGADGNVGNSESVSIELRTVKNASTYGNYAITLETLNSAQGTIDGPAGSTPFTIGQPQALDHFAVSPSTINATVGDDITLTITAQDANNATVTGYSGNPTLSGLATSPNSTAPYYGPVSFSNGVANVIVRSYSAQSGQSVTVTDGAAAGNSGIITFNHAATNSIAISPASPLSMTADQSQVFTVSASDQYGNSWDATGSATYYENDPDGTFIGNTYNAGTVGSWTIYATVDSINSNNVTVNVSHGTAVQISLAPNPHTVNSGSTVTYTVTAADADNNSWEVTSDSSFSIDAGAGGSWLSNVYTSANAGTWTVTGTFGSLNNTASLTVTSYAPVLFSIQITPDSNQTITAGNSIQFSATGYDQYGNPMTGITFNWTGTDSNGLFNSTLAGTYTIYASAGSITSNQVSVTVNPAQAATVLVFPFWNETIAQGSSIEIWAIVIDAYGNAVADGTVVNWTRSNTDFTLGSISSTTVDGIASVILTAPNTADLSTTVTASVNSINSVSGIITTGPTQVLTSIQIIPFFDQTITAGETIQFEAIGYDQYGNVISGLDFTWHNTDSSGLFNNTKAGGYSVYASCQGVNSDKVVVTVKPNIPSHLTLYPTWVQNINPGDSVTFEAKVKDNYDNWVADGTIVTWYSTNSNFKLNATYSTTVNGIAKITVTAPDIGGLTTFIIAECGSRSITSEFIYTYNYAQPSTDDSAKTETTTITEKIVEKLVPTAKAAEKKEEEEKADEIIEDGEVMTEFTPLIEAASDEAPTRNWWIPIIVVILVLIAAYYGYVALAGKSDRRTEAMAKKIETDKKPEKKISKAKKTDSIDTEEIKPIDDKDDADKTRW